MPRKKVEKIKKIELEIPKDEVATVIEMLTSLQNHPGWIFIKKILDQNVFNQEKKILNDIYDKVLKYNEEDLEKQVRRIYIDIASLPAREIARLTGNDVSQEEYDPYYKDAKDIR